MTKFKPLACGFHSHSDYSLDGASPSKDKIMEADRQGRIADCLTDHGIMSGLAQHWSLTGKLYKDKKTSQHIKSIHGIEAYVIDPDRPYKEYKSGKKEPQYYHLTIHFKTTKAYEYFCVLTKEAETRAVVKFGEKKPLITFEELEPIASDITLGSGCLLAPIQRNVLAGRSDLAKKYYEYLRSLVGPDNFWVEIMPHSVTHDWKRPQYTKERVLISAGYFVEAKQRQDENAIDPPFEPDSCNGVLDLQQHTSRFVLDMAKKYKDRAIISLDDHFATIQDYTTQNVRLGNGTENWKFHSKYYMMNSDECAEVLKKQLGVSDRDIEEWIDNSYAFVEKFKDYKLLTLKDRILLPTMETIYGHGGDTKKKLYELINKHGRMPPRGAPGRDVYEKRAMYEISVLADNGVADFLPYMFVIEDATEYARKNDILNNVRGSAGGSLIAYLLGLSVTDPIKYNLPFERFLTLGRIKSGSLPDIDGDWPTRDVILDYIKGKYTDNYALISSDMKMRLKSAILDVERSERGNVPEAVSDMCKKIKGAQQGQTDKEWLFGYTDKTTGEYIQGFLELDDPVSQQLRDYKDNNPTKWESVMRCIGITKTRGTHAGGVVITPKPVNECFPVVVTDGGIATAYEMKALEEVGGVKYDFLGVSTLAAMSSTMKAIKKDFGVDIKWGEFPHDPNVYKHVIHADKLAGIFQINTKLVKPFVQKTLPMSIEDISTLTALCRPGALDAPAPNPDFKGTAADYFVAVSQGREEPYYIHSDIEHILKPTKGVMIFQEQALEIFRFVGYTFEQAEDVRRAIGKKDKNVMDLHLGVLRERVLARGWSDAQATSLCDTVVASARYAFNCLTGDTLIRTQTGVITMVEAIAQKSKVLSLCQVSGETSYQRISNYQMAEKTVYEYELEDGSVIKCTPDHLFLTDRGWMAMDDVFSLGAELLDISF